MAQLCSGSLGDPVINYTFGRGPNPGPALTAKLPNLNYTANICPNDGQYTVSNSTISCFGGAWFPLATNHTPNEPDGYMMVINASFNSGDFYVDTVKGLCTGTTFEFAAWVLDVLQWFSCGRVGINPNLTFTIETTTGIVLGSYNTGPILHTSVPVWKQYGVSFTTPAGISTVVLRITNSAPGGCGNDLILDDITFRPCGPAISIAIPGSTNNIINTCIDSITPVKMQATVGAGYVNPAYRWQQTPDDGITWVDIPGATTLSFTYTPPPIKGNYKFRLAVAESTNINFTLCRVASIPVIINVNAPSGSTASSNGTVCSNNNILLFAGPGSNYTWRGPNGFTSTLKNPVRSANLSNAGKYYLNGNDSNGCAMSDSVLVVIKQAPQAHADTAFNLCLGSSVKLGASGGSSYKWSPPTGLTATTIDSPIAKPTSTITYTALVGNLDNCADTFTVKINVIQPPTANAGIDKNILEGQSATLQGAVSGFNTTWQWIPTTAMANSNSLSPVVSPTKSTTYKLQVVSNSGCSSAVDEVYVRVFNKLVLPGAFSPNGDGINDTWKIESLITYPEAVVGIYDRYGRLVFQSNGYNAEWDGTRKGVPVPIGNYYYTIDLKNNIAPLRGSVFVLR